MHPLVGPVLRLCCHRARLLVIRLQVLHQGNDLVPGIAAGAKGRVVLPGLERPVKCVSGSGKRIGQALSGADMRVPQVGESCADACLHAISQCEDASTEDTHKMLWHTWHLLISRFRYKIGIATADDRCQVQQADWSADRVCMCRCQCPAEL
jgi:hypothetical protein